MQGMFGSCTGLTSLSLSNFNTSSVTNMAEMFKSCNKLTDLSLSSFNTTKVTTMYCMFKDCKGLKYLSLSSFDMSNVTNVNGMLSLGSTNTIHRLYTPYNNKSEISIETGSTLYYSGSAVTNIPANSSSSMNYFVDDSVHTFTTTERYINKNATQHIHRIIKTCSVCSYSKMTSTTEIHSYEVGSEKCVCGRTMSFVQDKDNIESEIILIKDDIFKEFSVSENIKIEPFFDKRQLKFKIVSEKEDAE